TDLSGNTIHFVEDPAYKDGEEVIYDDGGGTPITGLCSQEDKQADPPVCGVSSVDGSGQILDSTHHTLTVDSTTRFTSSGGRYTGEGVHGPRTCPGPRGGNPFQGVNGCSGKPDDNTQVNGGLYYVKKVGPSAYQLSAAPGLPIPVSISGGSGENHRLVPT